MYISDGRSIIDINDDFLCAGKDTEERGQRDLIYYLIIFYKNQQPIKLVYPEKEDRDKTYNQLVSILDRIDNLKYEDSDR